jgi:hypothetical protein
MTMTLDCLYVRACGGALSQRFACLVVVILAVVMASVT